MAKTFDKDKKKVDISVIAEDMGGRKPPQALEIEEAVLGALLLEPNDIADVLDQITAECFYKESHKKIFTAICDVFRRNDPVDILTVVNELTTQGELDNVGGSVYISQLSLKTGSAAHLEYHAKILLQKYIQRELISISYDVQKQAFDDTMPADKLVDSAEQKIFALAERNMKGETTPIKTVIYQTYTEISENQKKEDGRSGVPSGFNCIDNVTYGWQKADLIVLAAR